MTKLYDGQRIYNANVVEFFSTIIYVGGKSISDFLLGPMSYCQVRMLVRNQELRKICINLEDSFESLGRKRNIDFT